MALYPDIYNAVTALLSPGPTSFFGSENLANQGAPPRIIWEPLSDSFAPASQRGNDRSDPTARHTIQTAVSIHIWGAGWGDTLNLRDQLVQSLRAALGPNYQLTGGQWVGSRDLESAGKLYVLSLTINIPLTDPVPAKQTILGELQNDVAFQTEST